MWSVLLLTTLDICHYSDQNVVDSWSMAEWVHNKFWPPWWRISLSIRVQTMLNNIRFVFYYNINIIENVCFRAWAEKGIAWPIDMSSVVWNLIGNSNLANQNLRLETIIIVVKITIYNGPWGLCFIIYLIRQLSLTLAHSQSRCTLGQDFQESPFVKIH